MILARDLLQDFLQFVAYLDKFDEFYIQVADMMIT
jgi:hypothetical protein